jgi:hypothetical protein
MDPLVEGAERRPSLQIPPGLGLIEVIDQMRQHLGLETLEPAPLRHEPGIEPRAAVEREAVEKLAREAVGHAAQRGQGLHRDALHGDPVELQRIHMAAREVEAHRVALRPDPAGLADEAADLA